MVSLATEAIKSETSPLVIDVGTGSGAVALALAKRRPGATVIGFDISARAIACARHNAKRLGLPDARFKRGRLLEPLTDRFRGCVSVICTNVPYVAPGGRSDDPDPSDLPHAVFGPDADGLGHMRVIVETARYWLRDGGMLVFQLSDWQWEPFAEYLGQHGYEPIEPSERRPGQALVGSAIWRGERRRQ